MLSRAEVGSPLNTKLPSESLRLAYSTERDGFDEKRIEVNGLSTRYLSAGPDHGDPVILLHGVMDKADFQWIKIIPELARNGKRVIAPDLPGYGESQQPNSFGIEDYVGFTLEFMDQLGVGKADFISLSMGTAIALNTALLIPKRVNRIIGSSGWGLGEKSHLPLLDNNLLLRTISPTILKEKATVFFSHNHFVPQAILGLERLISSSETVRRVLVGRLLLKFIADPHNATQELKSEISQLTSNKIAIETFFNWLKSEIQDKGYRSSVKRDLKRLPHRTLLLHGTKDRLIPFSWSQEASEIIPNASFIPVDAGHIIPRERPDFFNKVAINFLAAG